MLTLAVAAGVFGLALDGGSYALTARTSVAIGIWWALALAVVLAVWPRVRPPRAAIAAGVLLGAFALLTGLSISWAASAEKAFAELDRVLLYLGVFSVAAVAGTRANASRWRDGLALGLVAVGLFALSSRLFGDLVGDRDLFRFLPGVSERLSYPVDYWNGLAILVALAFPLLLGVATAHRHVLLGALAVTPVPALAAVIYLASSRGGAATAAVGAVVFVALTSRRLAAAGAAACAGGGAVAVIAILDARPALVDGPLDSTAAHSQGHSAAILIALVCVGAGVVYALGSHALALLLGSRQRPELTPALKRTLAVGGALVVIAALAAADPKERFDTFKKPPNNQGVSKAGYTQAHLLSGGGSGRWQFWDAAVDEFESRPALGRGAGSYEAWWAEHGSLPYFIRDAHSLYFETLGELGVVGLCLLLGVLGSGLIAGASRIRGGGGEDRAVIAALAATFVAYAVGAGIDWMWELTVVSVVGFVCLGLLVGSATAEPAAMPGQTATRSSRGWSRARSVRVAFAAVGLAIIVCQAIPLLGQTRIRASQEAIARGDSAAALENALAARRLVRWASSPYLQLALVEEQTGGLRAARASITKAIDRDRSDWRLWLVAARLETKAGLISRARSSLAEARRLNPRSPLLRNAR